MINVRLVLKNSAGLVSHLFHVSMIFPDVNPQEDDARFRQFSKRAEDGPSRAGRLSKTFPEVPIEFRVSSGNPASRLGIPLGIRNLQGSAGNVGCSRAARCLRIVKISCIAQGIHLVLQILKLSQEVTPKRRIPPVARMIRHFSGVWLYLFLRNRSFVIPVNVLAISCATFLEESVSHFQFST